MPQVVITSSPELPALFPRTTVLNTMTNKDCKCENAYENDCKICLSLLLRALIGEELASVFLPFVALSKRVSKATNSAELGNERRNCTGVAVDDFVFIELGLCGGLKGGKGGFGALLRGRKAKPSDVNTGDCRDLATGRRLRDVQRQQALETLVTAELQGMGSELRSQSQGQQRQQQQQQQQQQQLNRKRHPNGDLANERARKAQRQQIEQRASREKMLEATEDAVFAGMARALARKKRVSQSGVSIAVVGDGSGGNSPAAANEEPNQGPGGKDDGKNESGRAEPHSNAGSAAPLVESRVPVNRTPAPSADSSPANREGSNGLTSLEEATCAADLEAWGMDRLKHELLARSMKCGGTLSQRAERLFAAVFHVKQ